MLRIETGSKFAVTKADKRVEQRGVAYVQTKADLEALSNRVLTDLYNAFSGARLKKFKTREDALERTWGMVKIELKASDKADPKTDGQRKALEQEIRDLKATLAEKTALLRSLGGGRRGGQESEVVVKVLALLKRKDGATKEQLIDETGAKKGYVDALISRILPEKGYTIERAPGERGKGKVYRSR